MRVVSKIEKKYPKRIKCNNCGSELEYEKEDIYEDFVSCYIKCPICKEKIILDNIDRSDIILNENNLNFPVHYFHNKNSVKISDKEINCHVRNCIKILKENPELNYDFVGTGDTMIFVFKENEDEEYYIYIGKNGYEAYVPIK